MDVQERFLSLKEQWKRADEEGRKQIDKEMDAFLGSLDEQQSLELQAAVEKDFERMHRDIAECKEMKRRIDMRKQLERVLPLISVSQFARTYFGKSASWLHQRINGNTVHGKPVEFTDEEVKTLSEALASLSEELKQASVAVSRDSDIPVVRL